MAAIPQPASQAAAALLVLGLCAHSPLATAPYNEEGKVESANLYGNVAQYGYYFMDLWVGTPANQRTSVIVDTGSRLVGFPCTGCEHCGSHIDKAFDFSRSSSASWVGCESDTSCSTGCVEGHCAYSETYSEGSSVSGYFFEDDIELGDLEQKNPAVKVRLGCHMKENRLFYSQRANGIMGLAPGGLGDTGSPTILTQLFADKQHVKTSIFSMCLSEWGGRLTVGGYNGTSHRKGGEIQWVRLRPAHYHFVFPVGLTVGPVKDPEGEAVAWGQRNLGVTIVDSGTTYTYFPVPLYDGIIKNIAAYCADHGGCAAEKIDVVNAEGSECWKLQDAGRGPADFPPIGLHFEEGMRVDWQPTEYLQERDDSGIWCSTFLGNNVFQTVLGISFMLRRDVIFDLESERLGLVPADCPEHYQPPPVGGNPAPAAPLAHRLYSIDGALAAELGYGPPPAPLAQAAPSAPASQVSRLSLAASGVLSLLAAGALLGAVRARPGRRRHPALQDEAHFLPCERRTRASSADAPAEATVQYTVDDQDDE